MTLQTKQTITHSNHYMKTDGLLSGQRIIELLTTRLKEITDREMQNESRIYLYSTGTYWVAFERSAFLLYKLYPSCGTMLFNMEKSMQHLMMTFVPYSSLPRDKRLAFCKRRDDYMEARAGTFTMKEYGTWYRRQEKKYS